MASLDAATTSLDAASGQPTPEWVAPDGPWDDSLVLVFDGGTLDDEQAGRIRITDLEIGAFEFVDFDTAAARLRDHVWQRLVRAVHVADGYHGAALDYREETTAGPGIVSDAGD